MLQTPFFAVVYGIDGVGKTSLVQGLVERMQEDGYTCLDFDVYKKETKFNNPFSAIKKEVANIDNPIVEFLNFTNSTLLQSNEISRLLATGFSVIKDRGRYDVCSHATRRGCDQVASIDHAVVGSLALPTHTILLTAREDIRRKRIDERGNLDAYDLLENIQGTRLNLMESYIKEKFEIEKTGTAKIVIDTSDLTREQVLDQAYGFLLS